MSLYKIVQYLAWQIYEPMPVAELNGTIYRAQGGWFVGQETNGLFANYYFEKQVSLLQSSRSC